MALLAALALIVAAVPGARAQTVLLGPPSVIDGPDPGIQQLTGLSVARDGTGGLVYLKAVGGVAHVFLSALVAGRFAAPAQLDAGLAGASSQPVIAASGGGLLVVAFTSGGELYVTSRTSARASFSAPAPLAGGAANPVMAVTALGKAYLAFTQAGQGGHDVRAAYYYRGHWGLESGPLDAQPADDAGTGTGAPAVAAAGDGVGIVAWGEAGHVYTRRIWGTAPSVVFEQADAPSLNGLPEVSADSAALGVGGDSSYVAVAFRETFGSGSAQQSRVLLARLRGSRYDQRGGADGLSAPGADSAAGPVVASDEYGEGLLVSTRTSTQDIYAMHLGQNAAAGPVVQLNGLPDASAPHPAVAAAGYHSGLVAWQQDPGGGLAPEIDARFFDGSSFGPELVASSPVAGPTAADLGLLSDGDIAADVALAWVQGTPDARQVVVAQLYQPPGLFTTSTGFAYSRSAQSLLRWTVPRELWPPLSYQVSIDGGSPLSATATQLTTPPLSDGPHTWQVTALNRAGLQSHTRTSTVWVDTVAPAVTFVLTGLPYALRPVHISVSYTDAPPPELRADASGIASVTVNWGDGIQSPIRHGKYHVYSLPGRYRLTITATDRAGNRTVLRRLLVIHSVPKRRHKGR